jgi:hypothetical protein
VGGVAVIAILVGLLFWCMRRNKLNSRTDDPVIEGTQSPFAFRSDTNRETALLSDKPIPVAGALGGPPGVTPYLLPRDYNSSSAAVIPHETAAPLAPCSILGRPKNGTSSGKIHASDQTILRTSYYDSGNSQQRLVASGNGGAPSELSLGSGSGAMSTIPFTHDQETTYVGVGYDRPLSPTRMHSSKAAMSLPAQSLSAISPPAFHADSGLQILPEMDADEVMSQATTLPPAYTPYLYNHS